MSSAIRLSLCFQGVKKVPTVPTAAMAQPASPTEREALTSKSIVCLCHIILNLRASPIMISASCVKLLGQLRAISV